MEKSGFKDIAELETELESVNGCDAEYRDGFRAGLAFAEKVAARQRYGVAETLKRYRNEIEI